jgi:cation:H+ antiporter
MAAPFLVQSVERIGIETGLGNTFIGATLMAFTTSLPELASSVAAVRLGAAAMAAGNLVGSNAFNMLIFGAMDALWTVDDLWEQIPRRHAVTALAVVLNLAVFGAYVGRAGAGRRGRILMSLLILALTALSYGVLYRLRMM